MKVFGILALTFLFGTITFSQNKSYLPFIRFHSDFEKESWSKEKIDYIDLYVSIDSTITKVDVDIFKKQLNEFYSVNQYNGKPGKKRIKEIEALYLSVHNTFLERYRENVDFSELIRKKEYNCVTASILYTEILNHYNIPFVILNEPNHVFLVAYPDEEYIVLQTTSPNFKDFQISKKTRKVSLQNMLMNKVITQKEIDTLGVNQVFEINYLGQRRVSENELIGYEYYNNAIFTLDEDKDYISAVQFSLRAKFLIPDKKEFNQDFAQIANMSLLNTSGLDSSALILQLITLDDVIYNHLNSKETAQRVVMFWLLQRFKKVYPDWDFATLGYRSNFVFDDDSYGEDYSIYNEDDYFDDYDDDNDDEVESSEENDLDDFIDREEQLKQLILSDLAIFENNILEFVKHKEWNRDINIFLYEMIIHLYLESDHAYVSDYMTKLKKIDPQNKLVKRNEARLMILKYEDLVLESPTEFAQLIEEFITEAEKIELSSYQMGAFQADIINEFHEISKSNYHSKHIKEANKYFDLCVESYKKCKGNLTESQRKGIEYSIGFLYMFKAENYSKTEEKRILKEGVQLLPNHKSLRAAYRSKL